MDKNITKISENFISLCQENFSDRLIAIYTLGSLGEHGDFSLCSDVDALLIDKIKPEDKKTIQNIWNQVKTLPITYADRLSVFWSSPEKFLEGIGRFPALDRLDLIEHGRLLYGKDCRKKLQKPSADKILTESAQFILDFMLTDEKKHELNHNREKIAEKGARYFTKFVLFPVRLLYTIVFPAKVASNKEAVQYFIANHNGDINKLVEFAYQTRNIAPYEAVKIDNSLLNLLPQLYDECVNAYSEVIKKTNPLLAAKLTEETTS